MENVVSVIFEVPSEAYQAFSEVKRKGVLGEGYIVSEMNLVKVEGGSAQVVDRFDSGVQTANDTVFGGLLGGLVGIIGGPLGMLLGGSVGALTGSIMDAGDMGRNATLVEVTAGKLFEGETVLVALVQEEDEAAFDKNFDAFETMIMRQDAADVEEQVERMVDFQRETERVARAELRRERTDEMKARADEVRNGIKARFAHLVDTVKDVLDGDTDGDGSWRDR